jgi:hypothetical protein
MYIMLNGLWFKWVFISLSSGGLIFFILLYYGGNLGTKSICSLDNNLAQSISSGGDMGAMIKQAIRPWQVINRLQGEQEINGQYLPSASNKFN